MGKYLLTTEPTEPKSSVFFTSLGQVCAPVVIVSASYSTACREFYPVRWAVPCTPQK
jgi:hypothetical protein